MFTKIAKVGASVGSAAALLSANATLAAANLDTSGIANGVDATGVHGNGGSLTGLFQSIVNILFFIIGALAVIMLIVGGIMYVVSAGDSKRVESAKNTILYAIIGIVVAAAAGFIVNFVLAKIG